MTILGISVHWFLSLLSWVGSRLPRGWICFVIGLHEDLDQLSQAVTVHHLTSPGLQKEKTCGLFIKESSNGCSKFLHVPDVEAMMGRSSEATAKALEGKLAGRLLLFIVLCFYGSPTWLQITKQHRNLAGKFVPTFCLRILCSSINFAFLWHD